MRVSVRGLRLTITNGRRVRAVNLSEVEHIRNHGDALAITLKNGKSVRFANYQSGMGLSWLAEQITAHLSRQAPGTSEEVPAAMRALKQRQTQ